MTTDTVTTTMPTCNEMRAPKTTREKISRPVESVPNQWATDGGRYRIDRSVAPTSYVAIHGAKSATSTSTTTITNPMIVRRFICTLTTDDTFVLSAAINYPTRIRGSSH